MIDQALPVSGTLAFIGGLISFLSPCVAPIVPGYLSFVSGVAIGSGPTSQRQTERVVIASSLFVLGFTLVFVAMGATAGFVGAALTEHRLLLTRTAGVVMIVMGLFVLGLVRVGWLYREGRAHFIDRPYGPLGAVFIGAAFALGWTPCIGPVLASILLYAGVTDTAREGALLLLWYSAGLGLPFVLVALFFGRFVRLLSVTNRFLPVTNSVAGVLLIVSGALVLTNQIGLIQIGSPTLQRIVGALGD